MGRKKRLELPKVSGDLVAAGHARSATQLPQPDPKIVAIVHKKPIMAALAQALGDLGIKAKDRKSLEKANIRSLRSLFLYAANREGRDQLSRNTGIEVSTLVNWIGQADIFRIPGIGRGYASLLMAAGVDSTVELGRRSPKELYADLVAVNQGRKIVRRPPSRSEVEQWISKAKALKRIIEY